MDKSEFIKEQRELHQGLAVVTLGGCVCLGFTVMYRSNPCHVPSLCLVCWQPQLLELFLLDYHQHYR